MQSETIEVAVGVITDDRGRVLVARRAGGTHQGGKWEFPGGKREGDESMAAALYRELHEELGIRIETHSPLITLRYTYPEKTVVLDTRRIGRFAGTPRGREGQPVEWRPIDQLDPDDFPSANRGIIRALQLPACCLITPDPSGSAEAFLARLTTALRRGMRLVILRGHYLGPAEYGRLADRVTALCRSHGARCMLNMPVDWLPRVDDADGLHLTAARLKAFTSKDRAFSGWLSAACHDFDELARAESLGVDFVTVSPVQATPTHPDTPPLGWENFRAIVAEARVPVYALGGLNAAHLDRVRECGGQGVAGIRGFWF